MSAWSRFELVPLLSLAAAVLAAGCAGTPPRAERWTAPPVGATWTMAQRNTGSYGQDAQVQVTRSDTTWQGQPAIALTNSLGGKIIAAQDGAWLAFIGRDGNPVVSFDPPMGWQYPLHVGKTWTKHYKVTMHAARRTVPYELACTVQDHGDVTVPAGTFPAFKIGCKTDIGNDETWWVSPEMGVILKMDLKRDARSPFGEGSQHAELVQRPALK